MPAQERTSDPATIEARRHAELIEALWRIQTALEASYQLADRQLRAVNGLEARLEAALRYLVEVLQSVWPPQRRRPPRKTGGRP
jgi:hypothetical protein